MRLLILSLIPSIAMASPWSGKLGLDSGSVGGILVHDFQAKATVSGIEWDMEHVFYNSKEVGEIGAYLGKRDTDAHLILGPSVGTPMGDLATFASNVHHFVDWHLLSAIEDYGQYVHAYFNVGWDATRINKAHAAPDLIGFGGVLKFGAPAVTEIK